MGRISTSPRRAMDEHLLDLGDLETRFRTSMTAGLAVAYVAELQASSSYAANILPTDVEAGHGAIHELVAVLRDGTWMHTRAENLVPGDVVSVKAGQCIPADIRLVEADDLWVTHAALTGEQVALPRHATTMSVFDSPGINLPYMQAANMVFYGTAATQGSGKGIVCRTGAETVLGVISNTVLAQANARPLSSDTKLRDDIRALGVACKHDAIPANLGQVTALVVAHPRVIARTVVTVSFGTNLPALVTALDAGLTLSESTAQETEAAVASYLLRTFAANADANALARALAACRHFPDEMPRDQAAIARFCDLFHDPTTSRFSASLAGTVSGCAVYVHFDQECSAHVVVLQGPAREVLSRCGKVRKAAGLVPLDTLDLKNVEAMLEGLESKGETVIGIAELYLDPEAFPVGTAFDIATINFPTANMVYLGALGLVDKAHPELIMMASHCQAADVNLYVVAEHSEFGDDSASVPVRAKRAASDEPEADAYSPTSPRQISSSGRFASLCSVKMTIKDAATDKSYSLSPKVVSQQAISISNTFTEWKLLLQEHPCVVIEGGSPAQIDLLVETLQDLGETVALVASGNANTLSLLNADVGFAVPTDSTIDLSEDAADFVLGFSDSPRCDAVRVVELAKQATAVTLNSVEPSDASDAPSATPPSEAKAAVHALFRDAVAVGRLLGLSEEELQDAFEGAMGRAPKPFAMNTFMTSMLTSMAALKP
ncbi:sodium/potassium-transporting ATPase subunit alpha-1-like [Achlya hypogyna]|uniref:Sodium/potassium-transporting ATPase subunit alpha-1-like n=1 Tax=Achlya hypogyna TaxID=1202772 RepID=A0A1V9YUZ6_ACHHY|nr:sodium/potassium-transporting ATPase subunit alpha-1-like [Achlya hypogyna]